MLTLETATGLLLQTTGGGTDVGQPYVATPGLLAHYGIRASQVESGAILLTSRVGPRACFGPSAPLGLRVQQRMPVS